MIRTATATWVGIAPLMVKNGQTVDPLNKFSIAIKEISSKRKKVETDYAEMKRIEFLAGLYLEDGVIGIPADCVMSTIIAGAKKFKLGKDGAAAIYPSKEFFPLVYQGPKDPQVLYQDEKFIDFRPVRVQTARVMRCRPRFNEWALPISIEIDEDALNPKQVLESMEVAGSRVGLCEFRPRFGRFVVEDWKC